MIITTKTIVTFRVPKDNELLNKFVNSHNMSEWTEYIIAEWISYSHQKTVIIEPKEEKSE